MIIRIEESNLEKVSLSISDKINSGDVLIIPTDTIYGIVCDCFNIESVKKIYEIKGREENKPFLILLKSIEDIKIFSDMEIPDKIKKYIPGMITFILPLKDSMKKRLPYLNETIAIRIADNLFLQKLLEKTNPIVAPSANPSGMPNINDYETLIKLFEDKVSAICITEENKNTEPLPSTIYDCINNKVIRQGVLFIE